LRKGEEPDLDQAPQRGIEIELHVPALIPDDYLADVQARLTLYKRIASATNSQGLRELQVEMIDRFGLFPEAIKNLFEIAELKLTAQRLGIMKIDFGPQGGRVEFSEKTLADPGALIRLIQARSRDYRLDGSQKLRILMQAADAAVRFREVQSLLDELEVKK
jgi:transcription-repair coupling factor (superfamily II helicase)